MSIGTKLLPWQTGNTKSGRASVPDARAQPAGTVRPRPRGPAVAGVLVDVRDQEIAQLRAELVAMQAELGKLEDERDAARAERDALKEKLARRTTRAIANAERVAEANRG